MKRNEGGAELAGLTALTERGAQAMAAQIGRGPAGPGRVAARGVKERESEESWLRKAIAKREVEAKLVVSECKLLV